jgi:hypothetical protein
MATRGGTSFADGHYYDSKAIAGVAIGVQYPEDGPLLNTEFTGGEHSVKARLEQLGSHL